MSCADAPPAADQYFDRMLDALLRGDAARTDALAEEALAAGMSTSALIDDVIAPALRVVGDRWADAEVTLVQEHLATGAAELLVSRLRSRLPSEREPWLVATLQGEQHRMGAQMAAAALTELGQAVEVCESLTAEAIVAAAAGRPGVCLACAGPWSVKAARQAAEGAADAGTPVLLGGQGWLGWQDPPRITLVESMDQLGRHVRGLTSVSAQA